ncbi:ISL3 family transposase [Winogradskya humida]|uniref:Transposase for insertion sequence element IS1557 n=1 Tax=Winogradskya humida TaxID=113566 RepID=A0ABQ4A8I4_9ACTN|nr:ISL3 family transposase [Actinoplanes humidus]GIE26948.1 transposase for insertion sequence element IS1557 [Actinoplanes humidus]
MQDFTLSGGDLVVHLRLRSAVLVCPCGWTSRARYDTSRRRWRHLDLGRYRVLIESDIRRIDCRRCGRVRTEWMPFARPGARHTRDFEDKAAWLTQRMSKRGVAQFLGTTWEKIDTLIRGQVADHLDNDDERLTGLHRLGVDEIAYRKGRKFLTVVTDHDTGRIVHLAEGRTSEALAMFYRRLGPDRQATIEAVSMDMTSIYREPTREHLPHAAICFDPFHVITWAGDSLNAAHTSLTKPARAITVTGLNPAQTWRKIRATLRAAAENLDTTGHAIIEQLRLRHHKLWRAWQLKERLRDLYRTTTATDAATYLKAWITAAKRSRLTGFKALARRIARNFDGIINAITHQLSNSLTEGLNAGIRRIQNRAHGYADLTNLTEMIWLCHGGIPTKPPTQTH